MAQTLGVIGIVLAGVSRDVEKGATVKLARYVQKPVLVNGKVHYSREYESAEIKFTTVFKRGESSTTAFPTGEVELQVLCDTGQSFIWDNAFISNAPNYAASEGGKVAIELMGGQHSELQNG